MAWDPLAPKHLAAAIALGGLCYMMAEPVPNWQSAGVGLVCIVAFAILSLLPSPRPAEPHPVEEPAPAKVRGARQRPDLDDRPPPRGLLASEPVVFKVMRQRRRERRGS